MRSLLSVSLLLLCSVAFGIADASDLLRARLDSLQGQADPKIRGRSLASVRLLADFYRGREYGYAWSDSGQVAAIIDLAAASVADGLRPGDFHAQAIADAYGGLAPSDLPPEARVEADILSTDALLRLIHHRRYGKVDPQGLDKGWTHLAGPYADELARDLEWVVAAADPRAEIEDLTVTPGFYQALKDGLAHYRKIADAGGWPSIPAGNMLRPDMSDARVPQIRERLRITGDFTGPSSESLSYDQALQAAVRAFQERHDLAVDAVVGPATLAAMNVPAEARVDQIRVNLERMRWALHEFPRDLLLVDIPGQTVKLLRDREAVFATRVIIGRENRQTPEFRDQLEYLEINPDWTVPPTILKDDILPAMRRNSGYLARKGLQVVTRHGKRVSPGAVNWNTPAARFPYLIRQPPGARNALGQIKFMFPNRHSVYLHDTPNRSLFSRQRRLYSSGCVRVEHPWDLALMVLNDPERWSKDKLQKIVSTGRTRWVHLEEPLPVILAYWTAEAGPQGEVRFREDVYARDAAVLAALDGNGPIRIVYREPEQSAPIADGEPSAEDSAPESERAAPVAEHPAENPGDPEPVVDSEASEDAASSDADADADAGTATATAARDLGEAEVAAAP